jgi:hypothetical protein
VELDVAGAFVALADPYVGSGLRSAGGRLEV